MEKRATVLYMLGGVEEREVADRVVGQHAAVDMVDHDEEQRDAANQVDLGAPLVVVHCVHRRASQCKRAEIASGPCLMTRILPWHQG